MPLEVVFAKGTVVAELRNMIVDELRAIELRLNMVNDLMADANCRMFAMSNQLASIIARAERIDGRLERIERRLGAIAGVV